MTILKIARLAAFGAALLPAVAQAQGITVTTVEMDTVRQVVAAAGCTVADEDTAMAVEAASGFERTLLAAVVSEMVERGEIVLLDQEGAFRLTSGDCAN
ncbi:hypothetical protein [Rhodovulum adriaticum]|uniref:Uncharacterized protein n=1 Tax=Rhodovulum adriaticum TaxID=35804 RepID=A0A4R2NW24_RHOAD|nr:hypothetical protein [Rhodovulum adriaticum]MBK1637071.1 hypothetical protein [Rhodovulum adriaticum]TCP26240.1 hypothetical protein EV656_102203 [Rhodovulum adriaticum]